MEEEPKLPATHVIVLQGGPLHGKTIVAKAGLDEIPMDLGNRQTAVYRRDGRDSPAGTLYNYVAPEKQPA